jgi:hypothetical protein
VGDDVDIPSKIDSEYAVMKRKTGRMKIRTEQIEMRKAEP